MPFIKILLEYSFCLIPRDNTCMFIPGKQQNTILRYIFNVHLYLEWKIIMPQIFENAVAIFNL